MAEFIPPWLGKSLATRTRALRPDWLNKSLKEKQAETAEVIPPELQQRAENRGSGDWTQDMLAEIRSHESSNFGYTDYFGRGYTRGPIAPPKDLNQMTVREVSDWQIKTNPSGPDTAAAGAYQIINKTLNGLIESMNLTGDELFDQGLQDRMAIKLMENRGLNKFLEGQMDLEFFAENMAKEWASLPVLRDTTRRSRKDGRWVELPVSTGQSYYVGDGVNKAFEGTAAFENYRSLYETEGHVLAPKETITPTPKPKREFTGV